MSNKINELAFEIRCKVEQIEAIQRAENYIRDGLIKLNHPMFAEVKTFEVLGSLKEEFLDDVDKLAEEIEIVSNTTNHVKKEGESFGKL